MLETNLSKYRKSLENEINVRLQRANVGFAIKIEIHFHRIKVPSIRWLDSENIISMVIERDKIVSIVRGTVSLEFENAWIGVPCRKVIG